MEEQDSFLREGQSTRGVWGWLLTLRCQANKRGRPTWPAADESGRGGPGICKSYLSSPPHP